MKFRLILLALVAGVLTFLAGAALTAGPASAGPAFGPPAEPSPSGHPGECMVCENPDR